MLKTSISGEITRSAENIVITLQRSLLKDFLLLLRSLDNKLVKSIKIVDQERKETITLLNGKLGYRKETSELSLGSNENGLVEDLILHYLNDDYFLGQHLDLEVLSDGSHMDLTFNVKVD